MKKPPPVSTGGGRKPEVTSSPSSLPPRPRPVHPIDQSTRPTSVESGLGEFDSDPDLGTDPGLDDRPGWDERDLDLEGDAELRALFAKEAERPSARVYLAGPVATFEDGRYERALEVLLRVLPQAEIIDVRGMFRSSRDWRRRWLRTLGEFDRLVFIPAEDETVGWGVVREVFDAHNEALVPVHLLDLESKVLVPLEELVLISTEKPTWRRAYYVLQMDRLLAVLTFFERLADIFRRVA